MTKRLILIVSDFPKLSETFIVNKFVGLHRLGWDVHIVCDHFHKDKLSAFPSLLQVKNLSRHVHQSWPHSSKINAFFYFPFAVLTALIKSPQAAVGYFLKGFKKFRLGVFKYFYLDAGIISLDPDIVHFEFGTLAVTRSYLRSLLDVKLSVSFRGYDLNFSGITKDGYYLEVWRNVSACHFLGNDLRQWAIARGCPSTMRYKLIPPAVDLTQFPISSDVKADYATSESNPFRILSVGRLEWKKGYEFAFQAVKMLMDMGISCQYRIIGDGEYKNALFFARYQMSLDGVIDFCGALSHAEVVDQLRWANVLLHPSLSEGFCNAVLEAQAMRVPVICSDAGGLPENVIDGITGYVVPRRDPQALAEKLRILAYDPDIRLQMGNAGRLRVEQHFPLEKQIADFDAFYIGLI